MRKLCADYSGNDTMEIVQLTDISCLRWSADQEMMWPWER